MTDCMPEARLHEAVDGRLEEAERDAVERHLAACPACRREVEALRALRVELEDLPREIAPQRDLLPGIHARLRPREEAGVGGARTAAEGLAPRARPWRSAWAFSPRPVAAAAILLLAVASLAAVALLVASRGPEAGSGAGEGRGGAVAEAFPGASADARRTAAASPGAIEREYGWAVEELAAALREALREGRDALAPSTVRILEENLAVIDRALQEARAALEADPGNRRAGESLISAYRVKLDLLRRAAALAAEG